jgi:ArsR family transcriptional regulator, lead/cadmium/zinc/bismuth-responsive transcriptional repressor
MKSHEHSLKALNPKSVKNARNRMPSKALLSVVVGCFKALGDPTRAKILYALRKQPLCVRDLAVLINMSESAVSHQLRILRTKHLVSVERDGNTMNYSIAYEHIISLLKEAEYYADHISQHIPAHNKKPNN